MASLSGALSDYWRLARGNRNFRRLWCAQIVSEIGDWFYAVAIYSLLLEFTGKASSVGIALVCQLLPQTFIGPMAGVINDRISRKKVMIAADLSRVLIVGAMLLVRSRSIVWLVYPLLFLETIMWGFFEPARTAALPNIAPKEDLITANTLQSTTWSANFAIGALLGGLAAAFLGRPAVFVINAGSFLLSALIISRMDFHEAHTELHGPLRLRELVDFKPVADGIRYVRSDIRLAAIMMVKTGIGIMGASWVIFPVMGERVFPLRGPSGPRGGMLSMSLLMASRGFGSLIGPLLAGSWAGQNQARLRTLIMTGLTIGGVGYMLLGMAPGLVLACAAVMFAHMGASNIWVSSTTLLQMNTDDRFRGRVFSADLSVLTLMMAISTFFAGRILDAGISARELAVGVGATVMLPAAAWLWAQGLWKRTDIPAKVGAGD
ncbi:MAG TPA: MFS transporter [Terriglobales bacterium]|nr:MFS transporter [Terriglobales bacterium]